MTKLWGGRFAKATDRAVEHFHSSISFDQRLYRHDILGSIAHATMLGEQGIISTQEADQLVAALKAVERDIEDGTVELAESAEDIHMNIETLLIARLGATAKKLHTARSRNDQVALDLRLYLRDENKQVMAYLVKLISTLAELASHHTMTVMPGYTHLQKAQPVTFAHHLLAYVAMFQRDHERLADAHKRINICPLGAGALAGTTFAICRERVAELLGFDSVTTNSLDAVGDRDFAIELCADLSLIMMHLSRLCEELILWSSSEFGFIQFDDGYSTGSSMMPQKKNPDVAELIRGKTGRVYGDLTTLLTMMKGLPLAYNKDMQEDKEAIFDAIDTVKACLQIAQPMLATLTVNKAVMASAANEGFMNATDLADYLVQKGLPFREAHEIVGKAVLHCLQTGVKLEQLPIVQYKEWSPLFDEGLYTAISLQSCVNARSVTGGPAPEAVNSQLKLLNDWLGSRSDTQPLVPHIDDEPPSEREYPPQLRSMMGKRWAPGFCGW